MLRALRFLGQLTAPVAAVAVFVWIGGAAGLATGGIAFLVIAILSDRWWRKHASAQALRRDLEDRVRNPPA